mmetsp:Transcript_46284/g.110138  ORF Transcript_46284/g.110138 Transcript_46284/m.110138 type:complete len:208 (-) Transcript_46284:377-1000(-)
MPSHRGVRSLQKHSPPRHSPPVTSGRVVDSIPTSAGKCNASDVRYPPATLDGVPRIVAVPLWRNLARLQPHQPGACNLLAILCICHICLNIHGYIDAHPCKDRSELRSKLIQGIAYQVLHGRGHCSESEAVGLSRQISELTKLLRGFAICFATVHPRNSHPILHWCRPKLSEINDVCTVVGHGTNAPNMVRCTRLEHIVSYQHAWVS